MNLHSVDEIFAWADELRKHLKWILRHCLSLWYSPRPIRNYIVSLRCFDFFLILCSLELITPNTHRPCSLWSDSLCIDPGAELQGNKEYISVSFFEITVRSGENTGMLPWQTGTLSKTHRLSLLSMWDTRQIFSSYLGLFSPWGKISNI